MGRSLNKKERKIDVLNSSVMLKLTWPNIPEIHLEEFPSVTKYYHNHEFDHEERLDYHFL